MFEHGIDDRQQLAHASQEGHLLGFAGGTQAPIEGANDGIEPRGPDRRHVQHRPYMGAPTAPSPFSLPPWVERLVQGQKTPLVSLHDRMRLVIRLALSNVEQGSGGPFGTAVFEARTGAIVSVGINLVTVTNCSHAHAEMVALANAQQQVGSFDLGAPGMQLHELVTSCEPCAMCFGAILLSGVRSLVCGARSEDAEAFGFDEGAKPKNWAAALQERGITVSRDVCRDEVVTVFREYQKRGGLIYTPRRGR